MFAPVRVAATFVFLGSIALVFVGAFVIGSDVREVYMLSPLRFLMISLPL